MKYLKTYNESIFDFFKSRKIRNIKNICQKYYIDYAAINSDGTVDVNGDAILLYEKLTKLPLTFNRVNGDFYCSGNQLTSLEGAPKSVGGVFFCNFNRLTSLEGAPESVGGDFYCNDNRLTSLEGCPKSVGGDFNCQTNEIFSFEHFPLSIGGIFYCEQNPIYQVWRLFKDYSKLEFFNECDPIREVNGEPTIILERLNGFLEEIGKDPVTKVEGYKCI